MRRIIITAKNEVGVLAAISQTLADEDINIDGLNTESVGDQGVVILTTADPDRALRALTQAGFRAVTDETIVFRLIDEPGALARVAEKFRQANVNIRSFHILDRHGGHATVALSADDPAKARALIDEESIV